MQTLRYVRHDLATHFDVCDTTWCVTKLYHQVNILMCVTRLSDIFSFFWLGDTTWWYTKSCHTHQNVSPSHVAHIATCAFINVSKMWHFFSFFWTWWYDLVIHQVVSHPSKCEIFFLTWWYNLVIHEVVSHTSKCVAKSCRTHRNVSQRIATCRKVMLYTSKTCHELLD